MLRRPELSSNRSSQDAVRTLDQFGLTSHTIFYQGNTYDYYFASSFVTESLVQVFGGERIGAEEAHWAHNPRVGFIDTKI